MARGSPTTSSNWGHPPQRMGAMNHKFINIKNCLCATRNGDQEESPIGFMWDFLVTSNESDGTIGVRIKDSHLHAPSTQADAHQNRHLNLGNGDGERSIIQFRPVILEKKQQRIMVIGFNLLLPTNHHKNTTVTIRLQLSEELSPCRLFVVGLFRYPPQINCPDINISIHDFRFSLIKIN